METILHWTTYNNNHQILNECIESGYNLNQQNIGCETPLILAVRRNNFDMVKTLVKNKADLSIVDINGLTAYEYAETKNDIKNYLMTNNDCKLNIKLQISKKFTLATKETLNIVDSNGFTPLMCVIWHTNLNHFNYYIKLGANVNQTGKNRITPLMLACFRKNFDIVKKLVDAGANINQVNIFGHSALTYACLDNYKNSSVDILEFLIEKGAEIDLCEKDGNTPLMVAALTGHVKAVDLLLSKKASFNICNSQGNTALAYAALGGEIECAEKLLERKRKENIFENLCGPNGRTPLSWAVIANQLEMVHFLLQHGVNINQVDHKQNTALFYAKKYNHLAIIQFLEERKATENRSKSLLQQNICLYIQKNDLEGVKFLLNNDGDPCEEDQNGKTPLIVAIENKNIKMVECLLENGAELTVHSALPFAIEQNNQEIVKLLLDRNVDIHKIYKKFKQSPILQAVSQQNKEIVKILLDYGANPNTKENPSPLRKALELKNFNIVKFLVEKNANINEYSKNEGSLLKTAISRKNLRFVVYLIEKGANLYHDITLLTKFAEDNENFASFFTKNVVPKLDLKKNNLKQNSGI